MSAREILRPGGAAVGLWAALPTPLTAELAARSGADYVAVDQQHGAVGPAELLSLVQAIEGAGALPLVRVGSHDPWVIGHALDLGAAGVIVPLVNGPEEAAAAVAACRFAPEGVRSWGRVRGGFAGEVPLCLAMVETRAGLEAVEAIAATPGLDGIYVGPSDLSLGLGLEPPRRLEQPALLAALATVRAACDRAGVIAGVHCLHAGDAARMRTEGFAMVTAGVDAGLLRGALADAIAAARE